MAYIGYETPEEAIRAFGELDNKIMLGRYLHIRPAYEDNKP
jgi:RNA recognition motif-containing protein